MKTYVKVYNYEQVLPYMMTAVSNTGKEEELAPESSGQM